MFSDIHKVYFFRIIFFVISVHVTVLTWVFLVGNQPINILNPNREKVVVKTVSLKNKAEKVLVSEAEKVLVSEESAPKIVEPSPPKPKAKKIPKQPESSKPKKDKAPVKKSDAKTAAKPKKNTQLHENLAKIQKNLDKNNSSKTQNIEIADVKSIETLKIDSQEFTSAKTSSYYAALVSSLKSHLKLPELGDVKVKITIQRNGSVHKLEILESKNNWNKEYLEKHLPELPLPPFGDNFRGKEKQTFTITLTNE